MCVTLNEVYQAVESHGIKILDFSTEEAPSLSVDGYIGIDVDKFATTAEEKVCLAHEAGHCETGSFYNIESSLDVRGKHELNADKWAVKKLIPKDELEKGFRDGDTEIWQIAERFDVTEDFVRKALYIHYSL